MTAAAFDLVTLRIKTQREFWGAEHRTQGRGRSVLIAYDDRTCTCKQDLMDFAKSLTIRFRTITKHLSSRKHQF